MPIRAELPRLGMNMKYEIQLFIACNSASGPSPMAAIQWFVATGAKDLIKPLQSSSSSVNTGWRRVPDTAYGLDF